MDHPWLRVCLRVVPERPHELKLPSELFYASCACANHGQFADIRSRFQMATQGHVRRDPACEARPPNCLVEEVVVDCRRRHVATTTAQNVDLPCSATKRPSREVQDQDHARRQSEIPDRERLHEHRSHEVTVRSVQGLILPYAGVRNTPEVGRKRFNNATTRGTRGGVRVTRRSRHHRGRRPVHVTSIQFGDALGESL